MNKDKIFSIVMFGLIGIGLLGCIPSLSLWEGQEVLALCVALAFVSLYFIHNIFIKLFALWNIVRFLMLVNSPSIMTLYTTIAFLIFYEALFRTLNEQRIKSLFNIVCVICIIEALFIFWQSLGIWIVFMPRNFNPKEWFTFFPDKIYAIDVYLKNPRDLSYYLCGTTGNINIASALFGLSFSAFFRRGWVFFIPLIIYILWLTHSLNGVLPVLVISIIYVFFKFKKALFPLVFFISSLFIFYFYKFENLNNILYSGSNRYDAWKIVIKEIIPLRWVKGWGVGQGAYMDRIIKVYWHDSDMSKWTHCHSEPLNLWIELGIIGLLIAIVYFVMLLWKTRKIIRIKNNFAFLAFLGVIAGLVNSLFSFSLHLNIGIVFFLFMVILDYYGSQKTEGAQ